MLTGWGGGVLGQRGSNSKTVVLSPEWFGPHWAFFYRYFWLWCFGKGWESECYWHLVGRRMLLNILQMPRTTPRQSILLPQSVSSAVVYLFWADTAAGLVLLFPGAGTCVYVHGGDSTLQEGLFQLVPGHSFPLLPPSCVLGWTSQISL